MFEWSEEQLAIRDAVRRFVEEEVKPNVEELEHGDTPPYEVIRKLYRDLRARRHGPGLASSGRSSARRRARRRPSAPEGGGNAAMTLIPIIELCHYCPGHRHRARGQHRPGRRHHHEERHAGPDGALGPRPADAGQGRRLGHHRARLGLRRPRRHEVDRRARRRRVRAQRQQDVHHQRPLRRHHRLLRQARRRQRHAAAPAPGPHLHPRPRHARARAVQALPQDGPALVADRRALPHRRAGRQGPAARRDRGHQGGNEGRESAKGNFVTERAGVAAMSLGLIEECLKLSVQYAKDRLLWERPIARVPAHPAEAGPHGGRPAQRGEPRVPPHRDELGRQEPDAWPRPRP